MQARYGNSRKATPKNDTNMVGTRSVADTYMIVLSNLSNNDKLELITRLSDSMRIGGGKVRKRPDLRSCFKGDWSAVDAESLRNATVGTLL